MKGTMIHSLAMSHLEMVYVGIDEENAWDTWAFVGFLVGTMSMCPRSLVGVCKPRTTSSTGFHLEVPTCGLFLR